MPTDIVIPEMGESVREGVVANILKKSGDVVKRDEAVIELETDKITMEIVAPASGRVTILANVGDTVPVGAVVGRIEEGAAAAAAAGASPAPAAPANAAPTKPPPTNGTTSPTHDISPPSGATNPVPPTTPAGAREHSPDAEASSDVRATPVAKKLAEEHGLDLSQIHGTGPGGRVREADVIAFMHSRPAGGGSGGSGGGGGAAVTSAPAQVQPSVRSQSPASPQPVRGGARRERMSPLRQRIAARLVEAQHTAAMLTTFNEVDMTAVMELRKKYKDTFEKKHGIGLGFMSFFVKACVHALKAFPAVNAYIVQGGGTGAGAEIEYHDYCDIAIAVGTPKGLVVPVLRGCENRSFADIESGVKELALKARDGKLTLEEMQGGTFTITNGGIYGSLMSTPILNPPQSGILGMHSIKNRAIEHPAGSGQVAIRPMMYLALSYDHRMIDGAEAVQFLVAVKNAIEEPERLLFGI